MPHGGGQSLAALIQQGDEISIFGDPGNIVIPAQLRGSDEMLSEFRDSDKSILFFQYQDDIPVLPVLWCVGHAINTNYGNFFKYQLISTLQIRTIESQDSRLK